MTREEAIKALERADNYVGIHYINGVEDTYINPHLKEAIKVALTALRPVSWEHVERIWFREPYTRMGTKYGENGDIVYYAVNTCMACGHETPIGNFCHNCGAAQTRAAVEMVMEKINNMEEMTNEH